MPRWPALGAGLGLALTVLNCRSRPFAVAVPVPCAQGAWSGTGTIQLALQLEVSPSCANPPPFTQVVSGTGTFKSASTFPVVVTGVEEITGLYFSFRTSDSSLTGNFNGTITHPDTAVGILNWSLTVGGTTVVGVPESTFTFTRQ